MADELDRQAHAAFLRDKKLIDGSVTLEQVYTLGWLRGRVNGVDAGMEIALPQDDFSPTAATVI